jgi:PucR family transcriptional regulator, proline-responsive transcriptional activator
MAITLSRLFANSEKNYNIKLIAGGRGLKNLVRWVHMVEDSEVPGFLHGNELILTTGIANNGNDWVINFVKSLRKHGAIGLVINVGPYIKEVPKTLIHYCDENEFPLFIVPWEIHLIDVTFDFCHRIIANEENETSIAQAFRDLVFSPENKEAYVKTLERRGFHNKGEYSLMIMQASRNNTLLSGDEWHNIQFSVQSVLKNIDKPICIFDQENYLVIVGSGVNSSQMEAYAMIINDQLFDNSDNVTVFVGISDTVIGYNELCACYKQAVTASNTAKIQEKQILKYHDTGIYKLIYAVDDASILKRYVMDTINKISDYDSMHNTDYVLTLKHYLESNGSIQKVSNQMNVHRNTINYKMKSIRENFGLKLDYNDIARLWLAFNIKDIIEK